MTYTEIAGAVVLCCVVLYGHVMNIYKFVEYGPYTETTMVSLLRLVGMGFPPLGAVMGFV